MHPDVLNNSIRNQEMMRGVEKCYGNLFEFVAENQTKSVRPEQKIDVRNYFVLCYD